MRYIGVLLGVIAGLTWSLCRAHAITDADASAKCATAADHYLRDPSTAKYLWGQEIITRLKGPDNWLVVLPARAQNGFGAFGAIRFVCKLEAGKVVEVAY